MAKKSAHKAREGNTLPSIVTIYRIGNQEFKSIGEAESFLEKADVEGRSRKLAGVIVGKAAARIRNEIRAGVEYMVRLALRDPAAARQLLDLDVCSEGGSQTKAAAPKAAPAPKKVARKKAAPKPPESPSTPPKKVARKKAAPKGDAPPKAPESPLNLDSLSKPPTLPPDIIAASKKASSPLSES